MPPLAERAAALRTHAQGVLRAWRLPLTLLAAALFTGGSWWSFAALGIGPADLAPGPLLAVALLTIPASLYSGLSLSLLARSLGVAIPVGRATLIGAHATLAEMLPLPGGALVRAGALMRAGGSMRDSALIVLAAGFLWIGLGMIGAGAALHADSPRLAVPLLAGGIAVAAPMFGWIWKIAGPGIAVQTALLRVAGIALLALRLTFAFAAVHVPIGLAEAMPFALATIAGSASSIAPAGLGVSESLAALAATATAHAPGSAFLAVGLDRVAGLIAGAALALPALLRRPAPASS